MSRYIDADCIEPHEIYEDYGFVMVAYMDDIDAMPTADVVPVSVIEQIKWISVGERLPEERKWVLCQCRAGIRMVLRLQGGYWHQDSQHEFMRHFVTHWMPLPEPPKEET